MPPLTVVPPVYELDPVSDRVPAPAFVIALPIVPLEMAPPRVSVLALTVI